MTFVITNKDEKGEEGSRKGVAGGGVAQREGRGLRRELGGGGWRRGSKGNWRRRAMRGLGGGFCAIITGRNGGREGKAKAIEGLSSAERRCWHEKTELGNHCRAERGQQDRWQRKGLESDDF